MGLLAVLLALQRPAAGQHGAILGKAPGHILDRYRGNFADGSGPFGGLRRAVDLAGQIGQEFVEAGGILREKFLIVLDEAQALGAEMGHGRISAGYGQVK